MRVPIRPLLLSALLTLVACSSDDDDDGGGQDTAQTPAGGGTNDGSDAPGDGADDDDDGGAPDGLRTVDSVRSVAETIGEIELAITNNEALGLVADIDHAANADSVGETLAPTRVILFGNPRLGTPLMQASRTAGLDLPQKMLAWESSDGQVRLAWNSPAWLAARHGIDPGTEQLATIDGALATIAGNASGNAADGPDDMDGADEAGDGDGTDAADDPDAAPTVGEGDGVVVVESENDFETTYALLKNAIEFAEPLRLVAELDHAANAAGVGLELPPTRLLIFGNPVLGTPLMLSARTIGIDLPQKMLVWEEDGTVSIAYNDPAWLAGRHGITDRDAELGQIAAALEGLAAGAAADTGDGG